MAIRSPKYNWISVCTINNSNEIYVFERKCFCRIVQAFEKIATSFVQQDDFKSFEFKQNQTRFVAEKVVFSSKIV